MGWRSVIITQHAKLSYTAHTMVVQTRDGINQIPLSDISLLVVSTVQAVITSALISELSRQNTKIIFTDNSHRPISETTCYYPGNRSEALIRAQVNWNLQRQQVLWTKVVAAKIINQIMVLEQMSIESTELRAALDELEVNDSSNREAVIARKYFPLLFDRKFTRRDGSVINAALDYGYSILLSTVNQEVVANGYLTYLGIHHSSEQNDFNLSSDLMEPFRPVVDYWIANQKFNEFTPDVKYGLVQLLSLEIEFNGQKMLLKNAITSHVRNCLKYLSGESEQVEIEVKFLDEVPSHAINDNV